jgi:TRAP-type C4-dicarboxylate transport system permease small subunit
LLSGLPSGDQQEANCNLAEKISDFFLDFVAVVLLLMMMLLLQKRVFDRVLLNSQHCLESHLLNFYEN